MPNPTDTFKHKFVHIGEIHLSYREVNERSVKTIFFIHGNSGSWKTWKYQLTDSNLVNYRLVAIDLPGHGDSDHLADYSPLKMGEIVAKAVEELSNGTQYLLAGFSLGTNLIAEMMNNNLAPAGVVMAGMCCIGNNYGLEKVFKQSDKPSILFYNEDDVQKVREFMRDSVASPAEVEQMTIDYLRADKEFRPGLMKAAGEGKFTDEIQCLEKANTPIMIIFGKQDNLVNSDYLDHSELGAIAEINKIDGGKHFVCLDHPGEFNSLLNAFAAHSFKPVHALKHI
jgi:pimeloyl-ACP methyl ester carboxylesterase